MQVILKHRVNQPIEIPLSGVEIADLFWQLDQHGQAEFFNRLGSYPRLAFQLQAVTNSARLSEDGSFAMSKIGEYS
jgi:hypothetical protein